MITLRVNGVVHQLDVDPETPLLWVLNEQLGLSGAKYSCGIGECGACTVLINGQAALSCSLPVRDVIGADIVTIEGFRGPLADAIRHAWFDQDVVQCGYCQPAQILTVAALLQKNPSPSDDSIDREMSGVLCRCGTYPAIRKAIHLAAREYGHGK